jgi:hypothetical protein
MCKARRTPRTKIAEKVVASIVVLVVLTVGLTIWNQLWGPKPGTARSQIYATGLLQAIEGYHHEYGSLPKVASKGGELVTEDPDGVELLTVLLGKEETDKGPMENKKQMRFLSVDETKTKNKGGLLYSNGGAGVTPGGVYDVWGNAFRIRFATGDSREIPDPFRQGEVIRGKVAIVFSYGKNGEPSDRDDVKTW